MLHIGCVRGPNHLTAVVDVVRRTPGATLERAEVAQHPVLPEERVVKGVAVLVLRARRVRLADYLAAVVYRIGPAPWPS